MPSKEQDREYLIKLGKHIAGIRVSKGMTQFDLEATSNLSRTTIARIETGEMNPSILVLKSLAEGLSVDISELIQ